MKQYEIIKGYRAFDVIFASRDRAEYAIEGWEHKERVKPVWVIVDKEAISELNETGELSAYNITLYSDNQMKAAKEELNEMNN